MILGGFPRSFWKWSFHFCSLSFWLVAFSFDLEVPFLPLILLTVCHANRDCLSSTDCLILSICACIYSVCSFLYVLVSSIWAFLRLCILVIVGFVLLCWTAFLILFLFSLTASVSQGTERLALSSVGTHSDAASRWALTKFLYSSFGVKLSDVSWRISNYFLLLQSSDCIYHCWQVTTSRTVQIYWFAFCFYVILL